MSSAIPFTVFTKPWPDKPLDKLAKFIKNLGFDGIELPVRPGFQVPPEKVAKGLSEAARIFKDNGVKIGTIAAPTNEVTMAACAEAGVPIIRICVYIPTEKDYLTAVADCQREWDALVPLCEKYKVAIGVQNHCGRFIATAMHLRHAVGRYDPRHLCAVWDPAHNGLEGEQVDIALDAVWSHLRVVNYKSAFWQRISPPEAPVAQWGIYWTTGRHGRANWPWVAQELKKRSFRGDLCFSAEYSDHAAVDRLIAEDIAFARALF